MSQAIVLAERLQNGEMGPTVRSTACDALLLFDGSGENIDRVRKELESITGKTLTKYVVDISVIGEML